MHLAAHEAHQVHELTLSCVNSIMMMGMCKNMAKDPELKQMIDRHFPYHLRDYNKKVEFLRNPGGSKAPFPVPELVGDPAAILSAPEHPYDPITPRTDATTLNDREIATTYLLTLKRAGREYAWAAMEAANLELRSFLEDAFRMSSHHAYDVWQYMVKRGWYPLSAAPAENLHQMGNMYNLVQEQPQLPS